MRGRWLILILSMGCHRGSVLLDTGVLADRLSKPGDKPGEGGPRVDSGDPPDDTGDPAPSDIDEDGYTVEDGDCDDLDATVHPGAEELCNGTDDNCDGQVDEGLERTTWYLDADDDGWGDSDEVLSACEQPDGYVASSGDCDDGDATTYRDAPELCDGADNDCDGSIDEDVTTSFFQDLDGDGYGNPEMVQDACTEPPGFSAVDTDCDDTDPTIHPFATEICNELDDDCDGDVDEDVEDSYWYEDLDGDGYGDLVITVSSCLELSDGYSWVGGDCDDSDSLMYPGAPELCDGADNDCDGEVDEDGSSIWYVDADGDGDGDLEGTYIGCEAPTGYVSTPWDCDDSDPDIHPGADEYCNDEDDDCDGEVDESAVDVATWYRDVDGDGYGSPSTSVTGCTGPLGYVEDGTDCEDGDAAIHPDADEICNDTDDDCDGATDIADDDLVDGFLLFADMDGDGWGETDSAELTCEGGPGWADVDGDCDDTEAAVHPGAAEACDGLDNNCDGETDPGFLDSDDDGIANCVDESVYLQDFSTSSWDGWSLWDLGGGTAPYWTLTGRYLLEISNAANAIAYSPFLGELDAYTVSVDIMQISTRNNASGLAFALEESEELLLIEWWDPTAYYGWYSGTAAILLYEYTGSWTMLASVTTSMDLTRGYGEWATLGVRVDDDVLRIYLDEDLVLTHTYSGILRGPGRVGVWSHDNDNGVYFDDVTVTQP